MRHFLAVGPLAAAAAEAETEAAETAAAAADRSIGGSERASPMGAPNAKVGRPRTRRGSLIEPSGVLIVAHISASIDAAAAATARQSGLIGRRSVASADASLFPLPS